MIIISMIISLERVFLFNKYTNRYLEMLKPALIFWSAALYYCRTSINISHLYNKRATKYAYVIY